MKYLCAMDWMMVSGIIDWALCQLWVGHSGLSKKKSLSYTWDYGYGVPFVFSVNVICQIQHYGASVALGAAVSSSPVSAIQTSLLGFVTDFLFSLNF